MRRFLHPPVLLLCAAAAAAPGRVQDQPAPTMLPVPVNVTVDGVPPVPASLADAYAPYTQFRRARLLAWHPAERRILIATRFAEAPQIHEVSFPGGARRQLTFFRDGVAEPDDRPLTRTLAAYEPDGRFFIFQKDVSGGGEANQLFRYDAGTGAATLMTDGVARNEFPVMSRQGLVAYSTTRRNGKDWDIHVMDPAQPSSDRPLLQNQGAWAAAAWSADGAQLVAIEVVSTADMRLWLIDATSGRRSALTAPESAAVRWSAPVFAPDGKAVYALSNRGGEATRLWRRELARDAWVGVTRPEDTVDGFALSPDGRTFALAIDRGSDSILRVQDAAGKTRVTAALPRGVVGDLLWHPSGRELGLSVASARSFHDVYSVQLEGGKTERWTTSEMGGANPESLPEAEIVEWKSFDGLSVSGVLYRPPARFKGPRPVIINIHGGPDQRERPRPLGRSNYFRNELGIAVIYPNVRGSSGFGRSFEALDNGRLRENAVKDIGALLDWIAAQPGLDKSRVMVVGASYGGYMALASAIEFGDRLRCAQAAFAIADFPSFLESTDMSRQSNRNAEYGDPAEPAMRAFLTKISPLTNADRLRIPLYLVHGARDTRVPLAQADMLAKALRQNGTPLWYAVYQDAGHLTLSPANNDYNQYSWTMFVQKYLLN